jgi:predicted RNA-binding protein with PUA-like domain
VKYWLVKSEPEVYSIDKMAEDGTALWENVRNYQARNFMMKDMKVGDKALFYHSNAKPAAVVGVVEISDAAQPDPSQFDKKSEYFEPKASKEKPMWFCVEVRFREKLDKPVSLDVLKKQKSLAKMVLLNNSRLSVQPVTEKEFKTILKLAGKNA